MSSLTVTGHFVSTPCFSHLTSAALHKRKEKGQCPVASTLDTLNKCYLPPLCPLPFASEWSSPQFCITAQPRPGCPMVLCSPSSSSHMLGNQRPQPGPSLGSTMGLFPHSVRLVLMVPASLPTRRRVWCLDARSLVMRLHPKQSPGDEAD